MAGKRPSPQRIIINPNYDAITGIVICTRNNSLLWDGDSKRFAIKPIGKKDHRSFPVRYSRKDDKIVVGAAFSGVMFLKHIHYDYSKTGTYPVTRNSEGSLYEVDLPEERFQGQPTLTAMEGGKKHAKALAGD
jgi:hypothetical protein